jgi:hypothetical protein
MTKLTDKPLFDAARNEDGKTYNGITAMRWMYEALSGKPLSQEEALKIAEEAKAKAAQQRAQK